MRSSEDLPVFVVASSRAWNHEQFVYFSAQRRSTARWIWVDSPEALATVAERLNPRYVFFLHWNWLVPEAIWSKSECIVFHMTDLPYGRGGSPLQNLIVRGLTETKLSALRMTDALDAGPIYLKRPLSLSGSAREIYARATTGAFEMIDAIIAGQIEPVEQSGDVTVFQRRKPADSEIPTRSSLGAVYDHIRMLDAPGYPNAFIDAGHLRITFTEAEMNEDGALKAQALFRAHEAKER